jgi:hypothetical protein
MGYALIFAILAGKPVVVEYRGPILQFDRRYADVISYEEAEAKIKQMTDRSQVYFWPPKRPIMQANTKEALDLLHDWMDGKPTTIPKRTKLYRSKLGAIVE